MSDLTLFDSPVLLQIDTEANPVADGFVRTTDPATSHTAADEDRSTLELDCLAAVRAAGWHGATSDEVWAAVGRSRPNSIARRLTTLCRAGAVEVVGTRPGDSGRAQQVYRSTPQLGGF